ncbi:MAG: GNAT family N-acetyltransferase, partial [candidate division NC10 bacterium]|nr:GNAT family N-acetyltransferase [candidate division NC10 bacterium]
GWASAVLNLEKSEEELRAGLSGNWRKQLSKAERLGVSCAVSSSPESFDGFLESYEDFLRARSICTSVTPRLLRELRLLLPEGRGMRLFEGRLGSECLGGLLVASFGESCLFLALAIRERGETAHAGHVMHWNAIRVMKQLGFKRLDVGGLDPKCTPQGILQFKRGLRASEYQLFPEIEASNGGWVSRLVRWQVDRARRQPQVKQCDIAGGEHVV